MTISSASRGISGAVPRAASASTSSGGRARSRRPADLAVELVGAGEHHGRRRRRHCPRCARRRVHQLELAALGRRAALPGMITACGGVAGSSATGRARGRARSRRRRPRRTGSPPSGTIQALAADHRHERSAAPRPRSAATTADPSTSAAGTRPAREARREGRRQRPCRDCRRSRMKLRETAMESLSRSRSMPAMTNHTLILGGTGKTGRRVAERLRRAGIDVRIGSLSARRVRLERPRTWPRARGLDAAYVSYSPTGHPGAAETIGAFAEGRAPGVGGSYCCRAAARPRHSAPSGSCRPPARSGRSCAAAGSRRTSASTSCSTRCWPARSRCPRTRSPEPFVDVEDIADVAVAALTEDGHAGEVYELTGPRALRFDEAVGGDRRRHWPRRCASRAIAVDAFMAGMLGRRPGRGDRARRVAVHRGPRRPQREPQDGVRRALGRAPRDFGEFARTTAATGVWA